MFTGLGQLIARRPLLLVLAWILLLIGAAAWMWLAPRVPPAEVGSFLPPDSPHSISSEIIKEAFPDAWANSMIALVAHRPSGLTTADFLWIDRAVGDTRSVAEQALRAGSRATEPPPRVSSLSPALPFVRDRLVSPDGRAALALINLPTTFISEGTITAVDVADKVVRRDTPPGLTVEITGSAGIGRDYFSATQQAADRTTLVTVVAVLLILILVYRSPIGAMVPLVSIGASVFVAFVVLNLLSRVGWDVSPMERIFCVVLMFGAGVDYALFWIARYREGLEETHRDEPGGAQVNPRSAAALLATRQTGPAILASAATTICGLTTMLAADLVPSRNAGKILALALTVALLAALTLAPALARLLGRWLTWPIGSRGRIAPGHGIAWPWLADRITRHPLPVLLCGTVVLTALAVLATRFPPRFDALQELPPNTSSARGLEIADAHFTPGQLYPNYVLALFEPGQKPSDLAALSREISSTITAEPGVTDVYALDRPLGKASTRTALPAPLLSAMTRTLYEGKTRTGRTVLRFELLMTDRPFSPEAINTFESVAAAVRERVNQLPGVTPQIMLSGLTSYIISVKGVVGADQVRVMTLATLVIMLIVFAMVRDLKLTLFMVLSTWLTYGATIALSNLFFIHVMHLTGLDWKVRMILFVIVVAVGQDYNIFLVSRLLGHKQALSPLENRCHKEAVREAIVRTGSVISSCGIIMAATLGSLWAGGLSLLRQLGFALALGILIDTFFVRPLLIPGFYLVFSRRPCSQPGSDPAVASETVARNS